MKSPQLSCDGVAGGHIYATDDMTGKHNNSLVNESLNLFILIEHEFFLGVEAGDLDNLKDTYTTFTKAIVMLFHGSHDKSEVHSALIVAEDHLTIIQEDSTHLNDSFMRFVERAIKFIKHFINRIGEVLMNKSKDTDTPAVVPSTDSNSDKAVDEASYDIRWAGKFTEIVELTSALLISGNVSSETDAVFIRGLFRLMGIKKTLTDYYKALKKIEEKHPKSEENPGRCLLLVRLLRDTEKEWQNKYLSRSA